MAKNDVILLDGIIDERIKDRNPSERRDEVFEFLVFEELLKDYDLNSDEIEAGWIDGRGDGGIDGFYVFINGHLLDEVEEFIWPRSNAAIDVWIVTCKHHDSFRQEAVDALLASFQELFDLTKDISDLHGKYSSELLSLRLNFQSAYRRLAIGKPRIIFSIVYASRGDTSRIGNEVKARASQIENLLNENFSYSRSNFIFIGAEELIEMHRKGKSFALTLPILEHLATSSESYVSLVRLDDYRQFVSDENAHLRRYLFDSNVRDYLGSNGVNLDIAQTLEDSLSPDFWWLNNGVTILATGASMLGKTIQLQNIQIVNGLQTTETIYRHYHNGGSLAGDRCILVKILVSKDDQVRDRIIRATNNQSLVELASLHATDKIQRDIEVILEKNNWFYERRKNYFRNIGKPAARFVTPIYVASAVVALIFKSPTKAQRLKTKFMRVEESYNDVFSPLFPITIWPIIVSLYKSVDAGLHGISGNDKRREGFNNFWRPLIAFLCVSKRTGTFDFSISDLLNLESFELDKSEVDEMWGLIQNLGLHLTNARKQNVHLAEKCCAEASQRYNLTGIEVIDKRRPRTAVIDEGKVTIPMLMEEKVTPELIDKIRSILPSQPWKPGLHLDIFEQVGCTKKQIKLAIQKLIDDGIFNRQVDGVVYNRDGGVIGYDKERVKDMPLIDGAPEGQITG